MKDDFLNLADPLAKTLASELDVDLQEAMDEAEWPFPIELVGKDGSILFEYFEHREEEIFTLEYGSERTPPTAVIRPFLKEADVKIKEAIEETALDYLFTQGILP